MHHYFLHCAAMYFSIFPFSRFYMVCCCVFDYMTFHSNSGCTEYTTYPGNNYTYTLFVYCFYDIPIHIEYICIYYTYIYIPAYMQWYISMVCHTLSMLCIYTYTYIYINGFTYMLFIFCYKVHCIYSLLLSRYCYATYTVSHISLTKEDDCLDGSCA